MSLFKKRPALFYDCEGVPESTEIQVLVTPCGTEVPPDSITLPLHAAALPLSVLQDDPLGDDGPPVIVYSIVGHWREGKRVTMAEYREVWRGPMNRRPPCPTG